MYVPKSIPPTFHVARWMFSRALGAVFFCAFASLLPQIRGLMGINGITPAKYLLDYVWQHFGAAGLWKVPTLAWCNASDGALVGIAIAGMVISVIMIAGVSPGGCALALWALYLSLVSIGSPFVDFQWDLLLLETGFLAALALPWRLRPQWDRREPMALFGRWLLWWLLFRLMIESAVVKLFSGDPTWRNLSALDYHFFTQPLPQWTAWYMHHAPHWVLHGMVILIFFVELVVPFAVFAPRRWRHIAAWILIGFQLFILLTGNYAFFNYLTIALCLWLFDDAAWPRRLRDWIAPPVQWTAVGPQPRQPILRYAVVAATIALLSLPPLTSTLWLGSLWGTPLAPLRTFNGYGLFAVMTTARPEVIIEGSNDGVVWQAYEMPWKPGDPRTAPSWVAPHQPRLDWQMWFAALSTQEENPWLGRLLAHVVRGTPDTLALFSRNPFPNKPPKYARAVIYKYQFTDPGEPGWWKRELLGLYHAPVSLAPANPGGSPASTARQ